jgi:hypothetical protein
MRTRLDLIMCMLGTLVLIGGLFLMRNRNKPSRTSCILQLSTIGNALQSYAQEHGGLPPSIRSSEGGTSEFSSDPKLTFKHFQALAPYIGSCASFICPNDSREAAAAPSILSNTNISYFMNVDSRYGDSQVLLVGDRNLTSKEAVLTTVTRDSSLDWHSEMGLHGDHGYVLTGDGAVVRLNSTEIANFRTNAPSSGYRLAFP